MSLHEIVIINTHFFLKGGWRLRKKKAVKIKIMLPIGRLKYLVKKNAMLSYEC